MAQENEAAWRLWNRCKAQWKSDWKLEYSDQEVVVAEIAKLQTDNAAHCSALTTTQMWLGAQEEIAALKAQRDEARQRLTQCGELARQARTDLRELDKLLDEWRKTNEHTATTRN